MMIWKTNLSVQCSFPTSSRFSILFSIMFSSLHFQSGFFNRLFRIYKYLKLAHFFTSSRFKFDAILLNFGAFFTVWFPFASEARISGGSAPTVRPTQIRTLRAQNLSRWFCWRASAAASLVAGSSSLSESSVRQIASLGLVSIDFQASDPRTFVESQARRRRSF